jgi:hypothetical protein
VKASAPALFLCLLVVAPVAAAAPTIHVSPDGKRVEVRDVEVRFLEMLKSKPPTPDQWTSGFSVRVDGKADLPAMLGSYEVADSVLRFTPRFPLVPGTKYRAVLDLAVLLPQTAKDIKPLAVPLLLPKPVMASTTVVTAVYPTSDVLPENQLKFYVHFSAPMSRGEAYRRLRLLDDKGKALPSAFLELDEELWDAEGRRFTLFFDPGRIKRGLKPREDLGPCLIEGRTYTLEVDRAWEDAAGNPMRETFRKTFKVAGPQEARLDPKTWKVSALGSDTAELTVTFPRPLDHALLRRMIWVEDAEGGKLPGSVGVDPGETRWRFKPQGTWPAAGKRWLVIDTRLEDLAGNSIDRAFEVDDFPPVQTEIRTRTVRLPIP